MAIRSACEQICDKVYEKSTKDIELGESPRPGLTYQPKITFLAVQKRHKTRFFVDNPHDGVGTVSLKTIANLIN